jgi:hypothetical protein
MNVEMVEQLRKQSAFIVRKDGPGRSTLEFDVYESPQGFTGKFAEVCVGISKKTKDRPSHGLRRDIAT